MPLDCKVHKCFSVFPSPLRRDIVAGVGWNGPFPGQSSSDNTSINQFSLCLTSFLCRQDLLSGTECSDVFQNDSFPPPLLETQRFFSHIYYGNQNKLLEEKISQYFGNSPMTGPQLSELSVLSHLQFGKHISGFPMLALIPIMLSS